MKYWEIKMPSMKAKKGNPFEYDTAYSLIQAGNDVERIDDNSKGLDLIVRKNDTNIAFLVECKNRQSLSWNAIHKIWLKTFKMIDVFKDGESVYAPIVVFKSNFQPTLVYDGYAIRTFDNFFNTPWSKRPKGYKIWR